MENGSGEEAVGMEEGCLYCDPHVETAVRGWHITLGT